MGAGFRDRAVHVTRLLARRAASLAIIAIVASGLSGVSAHTRERPVPETLWQSWNLDVPVLAALVLATWIYLRGTGRLWERGGQGVGIARWQVVAFLGGVAVILMALISPLDALGAALFSAHMAQHMLLVLLAPLLLAASQPLLAALWALPPAQRRDLSRWWLGTGLLRRGWHALNHPLVVFSLFAFGLWMWHLPRLYDRALQSDLLHRLEHATFFGCAFLMWWCVLETGKRRGMSHPVAILLLFVSMIQSGALGVILTFGPRPLYEAHAPWVGAWGLTRLEDQQLAGVIMWIPMGTWLALTAFVLFGLWIRSASKSVERAEAPVLLRPRHLADASDRPDNEGGRFDGEAIVLQTR
ncbi:hypothetical protein BH23CHL4_BH23CHL4_29900 [soil metagenome]